MHEDFSAKKIKFTRGGGKPAVMQLELPGKLEFAPPLKNAKGGLTKDSKGNQLFDWKNNKMGFNLEPKEMGGLLRSIEMFEEIDRELTLQKNSKLLNKIFEIVWNINSGISKIICKKSFTKTSKIYDFLQKLIKGCSKASYYEDALSKLNRNFHHKYHNEANKIKMETNLDFKFVTKPNTDILQLNVCINRTVNNNKLVPVLFYLDMDHVKVLKLFLEESNRIAFLEPYQDLKRYLKSVKGKKAA